MITIRIDSIRVKYFRRRFEVHVLTQRVSDWFDTRIGRTIQSVAASKWFGQMEPREL